MEVVHYLNMKKHLKGFTLIELLVAIAIIGILVTIATFAMQGARESARDARRKSDLEAIASALELYRSDCNGYPNSPLGATMTGSPVLPNPPSCSGTYMSAVPTDPQSSSRSYSYTKSGATYTLCAALEQPPTGSAPSGCGSCGVTCNYKIARP